MTLLKLYGFLKSTITTISFIYVDVLTQRFHKKKLRALHALISLQTKKIRECRTLFFCQVVSSNIGFDIVVTLCFNIVFYIKG